MFVCILVPGISIEANFYEMAMYDLM